MDFFEFLKISTIGPQHLRLNEDVLSLILELMQESKVLLICKHCECVLLTEKNNTMFMHVEYFTNTDTDTHVCSNCYRVVGSENLDSDLDNLDDT